MNQNQFRERRHAAYAAKHCAPAVTPKAAMAPGAKKAAPKKAAPKKKAAKKK